LAPRYPREYIDYLAHFHGDRDFFECHEVLEDYWKKHRGDKYARIWVSLIQAAVGMYHYRRQNVRGAALSFANSLRDLDGSLLTELGIDARGWMRKLEELRTALQANPEFPYEDINIPINDAQLIRICRERCGELGMDWLSPSDLSNEQLLHRHTLRDRSEIIARRKTVLALRRGGR
jgi:uncharacterized protein